MTTSIEPSEAARRLLEGYLPERDVAAARGIGLRTLRNERQRGDGPPWAKLSKKIWYPEDGFREWLKSIEQRPVRARKRA